MRSNRILIASSSDMFGRVLSRMLQNPIHELTLINTGPDALSRLREGNVDMKLL